MIDSSLRCIRSLTTVLLGTAFLASCGGGGGGGSITSTAPPPLPAPGGGSSGNTGPTFTRGVFENESQFKSRCETPRTAPSPVTGRNYGDVQGSTVEENFWLRSWSNNTYLWYDEITDLNPYDFTDRLAYFDTLKTEAITPSGKPKDEFHFFEETQSFEERRSGAPVLGYGARYRFLSTSPPRKLVIAYVQDGSPASQAPNQLLRGTEILTIDGVDLENGSNVDALNGGLFPTVAGEEHTFVVRDAGATDTRTITLAAADVETRPVLQTEVIDLGNEKVGYMVLTTFSPFTTEQAIVDAISDLQNAGVNDLVLDLRYNGGGLLDIAGQLGYTIAGPTRTNGQIFDRIVFNDKHPVTNPVTGEPLTPIPFHSETLGFSVTAGQNLPNLDLPRVFLLSTGGTCSASESVINGLRGIDVEVILIGERTCGKPFGFYSTDNCGITYSTIQIGAQNAKGFGEYADGFLPDNSSAPFGVKIPGCEVPDDFTRQLGDTSEGLLAAALQYRADGTCPAVNPSSEKSNDSFSRLFADPAMDLRSDPRIDARFNFETNKFLDPRLSRPGAPK